MKCQFLVALFISFFAVMVASAAVRRDITESAVDLPDDVQLIEVETEHGHPTYEVYDKDANLIYGIEFDESTGLYKSYGADGQEVDVEALAKRDGELNERAIPLVIPIALAVLRTVIVRFGTRALVSISQTRRQAKNSTDLWIGLVHLHFRTLCSSLHW